MPEVFGVLPVIDLVVFERRGGRGAYPPSIARPRRWAQRIADLPSSQFIIALR
jgi:hypothetical protein